ncbi:FitA-like ribbon-helix-helix domain-containing protein [Azospirillum sp.]|uniref:FitA-like ribbon-helix-helix domain-containing protein n=1 Tax=Azospirillum sp. TaxID=34012 RepID=UPI003D70BA89
MGNITIRNVDDSLMQALEERASVAGRSLEEEARLILAETVQPAQADFWERMRQRRAGYGGRVFSDSGAISSEMRAERSGLGGES